MKWTGWAEAKSIRLKEEERVTNMLILTDTGKELSNLLLSTPDVRYEDLKQYGKDEKLAFIALSNLQKLSKIGYDLSDYSAITKKLEELSHNIITNNHIVDDNYLFFGYQEASREDLAEADKLLETLG